VVSRETGLGWRVIFPEVEHVAASSYLRELAVSDYSPATVRSYAFALLRWFRFLHERFVGWERAERADVRAFVEHLRETPNPQRQRRRPDAPAAGSVNLRTGKPTPGGHYAARTINHQLSVLFGFYEHACTAGLGPLVNPVPAQRARDGGRVFAHHNPMEDFVVRRRASYRQRPAKPVWRALPDDAAEQLFAVLRCHRDRALISFWLSSGARAAELLGLRHGDLDIGARTITVISKGSRAREAIPASVDSFAWLALYLAEQRPPLVEGGPVWWTRTPTPRPLNYHAARAVLQRANTVLGTNWTLHDLRHTAAHRMLTDPAFTLVDVQTILRHASVTTTQIYTQPRLEELIEKVFEHYARPPTPAPTLDPGYDADAVHELLGLTP
jgi:site-specific recombinase XerD